MNIIGIIFVFFFGVLAGYLIRFGTAKKESKKINSGSSSNSSKTEPIKKRRQ